MKAIVTAGGKGTRMRPLTFSSNKHFIPLANKPLLYYAIETIIDSGIKEIGVNYTPGQLEEMKSFLDDGKKWGIKIEYILQKKPLGLANIIEESKDFIGKDKFVMHLGDNIFYGGIKPLVDYFKNSKANGLLTVIHHEQNTRMGVPFFNKKGKLTKLVEKPKNPPNDWAIPGLYFGDASILKCFSVKNGIKPSLRGEYEITEAFQWLINNDYEVETKEFEGVWHDPGKFDDWLETNQFLLDSEIKRKIESKLKENVTIEGRVEIGKNCIINNSKIRGPTVIGNNVIIDDSYIGPYSSVSDGCKIEKAKIENTILLKNVQVLHPSTSLESCLIGEGTLIEGNYQNLHGMKLFVGNQCVLKI